MSGLLLASVVNHIPPVAWVGRLGTGSAQETAARDRRKHRNEFATIDDAQVIRRQFNHTCDYWGDYLKSIPCVTV